MEITANAVQTVAAGNNVLFTDVPVSGNCSIVHREGSGLVTLRGLTNQCRARYRAYFSANVGVPAGGTAAAISLALALDGEAINTSSMITTPAAVEEYNNVSSAIFIDVPRGCCATLAVRNTSTVDIIAKNCNLIVERVA